jgi:hypothetical protein
MRRRMIFVVTRPGATRLHIFIITFIGLFSLDLSDWTNLRQVWKERFDTSSVYLHFDLAKKQAKFHEYLKALIERCVCHAMFNC